MTFSDGQVLWPSFGDGENRLSSPAVFSWCSDAKSMPIDPLHANVTAFHGPISFDFGFDEWPYRLNLGEHDRITTVGEYLQAMNDWCRHWVAKEPDSSVTQSMQATFSGWEFSRLCQEGRTVYVLQ